MKDFFKNVGATMVGLLLFMIIMGIFAMLSIVGMVASTSSKPSLPLNSVLVLQMKGILGERSTETPLAVFQGNKIQNMGVNDIVYSIKIAKKNPKISGIYIENDGFSAEPAQLEEIRNALKDFKKSHKWIIAYGDSYGAGSYYLASVADKIYLNPQGEIDWKGIGGQMMYLKDALKKVDVRMVVMKVGKYKSATEMFTEDKMSDADREQTTRYLTGIWNTWLKGVSEARKIPVDSLNAYADRLIATEDPKVFVKNKMVDGLLFADEMKAQVKKLLKLEEDDDIKQLTPGQLISAVDGNKGGEKIAVYYASGEIVDYYNTSSLFPTKEQIVGDEFCKDMEELMDDDDVKAVVLRVNSPGGSAFASEKMWHAIKKLKEKKPVVVSMSGMAASGGYYMSCGANWIVAEPTTLTGSIGIFGMIPDASGLLTNKLGIKFDEVKTNKYSTILEPGRPITAEELSYIQSAIDRRYRVFLSRVAEGRKMSMAQVNDIAQGHVYLAQDAKQIKLVDEFGGLNTALEKAAKLAHLDEYYYNEYPAPMDFFEQLNNISEGSNYLDDQMREVLGQFYEPFCMLSSIRNQNRLQARLPYYILYN
ncbi:MAG: signal peptide peptidase SppA [Prevotella sp.]|jgi:protease-4